MCKNRRLALALAHENGGSLGEVLTVAYEYLAFLAPDQYATSKSIVKPVPLAPVNS